MEFIKTKADQLALDRGCYYEPKYGQQVIDFAESLFRPQYIDPNEPFVLNPWQRDYLNGLYNWRNNEGYLRANRSVLTCGKKNGKSLIDAIVAAHALLIPQPGVFSPEIRSFSTAKESAEQIYWTIATTLVRSEAYKPFIRVPGKAKKANEIILLDSQLKIIVKRIRDGYPEMSVFKSCAADMMGQVGKNLSLVIADELSWWENESTWLELEHSGCARKSALIVCSSTASNNVDGVFYRMVEECHGIQQGTNLDINTHFQLFEPPSDITDADLGRGEYWKMANPSLGLPGCQTVEAFRAEYERKK